MYRNERIVQVMAKERNAYTRFTDITYENRGKE